MSPASYQTAPPRDVCFRLDVPRPILSQSGGVLLAPIRSINRSAVSPSDSDRSVVRFLEAGNGTRTRDPNLGKVVLYQLSYSREAVRSLAPVPPRRNDPKRGT
jgi:hypothetical protein